MTNDYELTDLAVTYGENGSVTVTRTGNTATFTMPASDVTVTPSFAKVEHSVTVTKVTGGTVTTDKTTATLGDKVTLTISPDLTNDYELTDLAVTYGENGSVTVTRTGNTATFTMPASDVTVTPSFAKVEHSVTITEVTGGSVTTDKAEATQGETVTLTATLEDGYLLKGVEVKDKDNQIIDVNVDIDWFSSSTTNTATFVMPDADITVTPVFSTNFTAEAGFYVKLPKTGTKNVTIPANVASFKVYDDGVDTLHSIKDGTQAVIITDLGGILFTLET